MRVRKNTVDLVSIERSTVTAKRATERMLKAAESLKGDLDRVARLEACECPSCFYIYHMRVGGAAFTTAECGLCKDEMTFSSTATDNLCLSCARENELCKRCGGDLEMKKRRKARPFQAKT